MLISRFSGVANMVRQNAHVVFFLLLQTLLVAGCTHVAPYERAALAHPTMTADDMSSAMEEHVRAVSEGATGGVGGGGGGCGCN
jgi:hypothetical protein